MTSDHHDVVEQAIDWHLRLPTLGPDEWLLLTAWLEANPVHARTFDRIDLAARSFFDATQESPIAANDTVPSPRRRRLWAVGGAAIALGLAALIIPGAPVPPAAMVIIDTAPGEIRTIAFADGTRIELNGASRLRYDPGNLRLVSFDTGEATFDVSHDARRPFAIRSGARVIEDVGTVFNVARQGRRLDIEVAEGAVVFEPRAEAIMLRAGAALTAQDGEAGAVMSRVPVTNVGGWRTGRLNFTAEPLSHLAEAIRRRYGTEIVLAPGMSKQTFTGVITLSGNAERDMPRVAALIGARWRQDGARWTLSPEPREAN